MASPTDDTGRRQSRAEQELERLDRIFSALAHRQRRQILLIIRFRGGRLTASQIAGRFSCSWTTTSRHLRVLEHAGLVNVEARGRERIYSLNNDLMAGTLAGWLAWFDDEEKAQAFK